MTWHLLLTIGLLAAEPGGASQNGRPAAPADLPVFLRQADTSFRVRGWKSAAQRYARLVESNPTVGLYWYRLGESLRNSGRPAEAITPLEKAEQLGAFQPAPPRTVHRGEAAFALAAAHAALDQQQQALAWARKSLDQGLRDIRRFHGDEFTALLAEPDFRQLVWATDSEDLQRDEGLRRDLRFAIHELKRVHFAPFRATSEADIDELVVGLDAEIPNLSDDAVLVRMMAIVSKFGDAHTDIRGPRSGLPVSFFEFPEGLYIVAATAEHADLVGAKVLKIGNLPIDNALATAATLVARENPMMPRWLAPAMLRSATVWRGCGWAEAEEPCSIQIEDTAGETRSVALRAIEKRLSRGTFSRQVPGGDEPLPRYLRHVDKTMWHELLPDGKTMYCQLNGIGHARVSFKTYFDRLFDEIENSEAQRLILDLRLNGGGNTFLNPPLINGILRSEKLQKPRSLFVIMGRGTFSAALNTLDDLERRTGAILVGEPTSSPPNFIGERIAVELPYSGWTLSISDLSWQTSFPMDYRVWVSPTLFAPPTAAAFRAHRDPALEAIQQQLAGDSPPNEKS